MSVFIRLWLFPFFSCMYCICILIFSGEDSRYAFCSLNRLWCSLYCNKIFKIENPSLFCHFNYRIAQFTMFYCCSSGRAFSRWRTRSSGRRRRRSWRRSSWLGGRRARASFRFRKSVSKENIQKMKCNSQRLSVRLNCQRGRCRQYRRSWSSRKWKRRRQKRNINQSINQLINYYVNI